LQGTPDKQTAIVTKKQDLSDEADQYNPQTNKQKKKQLKSLQKDKKKGKKSITPRASAISDADYDFLVDYGGEDDIDIDDIED
jgi:hypothetical protein